jgi:hypothetical protein
MNIVPIADVAVGRFPLPQGPYNKPVRSSRRRRAEMTTTTKTENERKNTRVLIIILYIIVICICIKKVIEGYEIFIFFFKSWPTYFYGLPNTKRHLDNEQHIYTYIRIYTRYYILYII